jgi:hypothetical protein
MRKPGVALEHTATLTRRSREFLARLRYRAIPDIKIGAAWVSDRPTAAC